METFRNQMEKLDKAIIVLEIWGTDNYVMTLKESTKVCITGDRDSTTSSSSQRVPEPKKHTI